MSDTVGDLVGAVKREQDVVKTQGYDVHVIRLSENAVPGAITSVPLAGGEWEIVMHPDELAPMKAMDRYGTEPRYRAYSINGLPVIW